MRLQGQTQPCGWDSGASGITNSRKGKTSTQAEEEGKKESVEQWCEHQGQRRRREGGALAPQQRIPCRLWRAAPEQISALQPVEDTTFGYFLKEVLPTESAGWRRQKVWGWSSGREEQLWTDCNPHAPAPLSVGNVEVLRMKEENWPWKGKAVILIFFGLYFSLPKSFLIGNKYIFIKSTLFCLLL